MAVYTEVGDAELEAFLAEYDIGEADALKGVAEGVENSNYLLTTDRGQYFLTLYEKRVDPKDLPFFLGLMDHLSERGINCPKPIHGRDGNAVRVQADRGAMVAAGDLACHQDVVLRGSRIEQGVVDPRRQVATRPSPAHGSKRTRSRQSAA